MLIGIDASRANKKNKTGVEWYSYYLIQALKEIPLKSGDKFILYSKDKLKGDLAYLPNNWQNKVLSWPFKYIWTHIRLSWEIFFNSPDVLFIPSHALPIFCRCKKVITIHDLGFKRFKKVYPFFERIYSYFVHWWANKKADNIIVPSNFTKEELIELYHTKEEKIKVIYEGYDKEKFNLNKNQAKINQLLEKYKIEKPYFLFIGRLVKKKNITNLIKAYSKLFNSEFKTSLPKLVLIGSPGFNYKETALEIEKIKQLIYQIGYIPADELTHFYHGAEAFIFPSFYEGFGLPVLEAMACGIPVIASKTGSIPEISNEAALYFDPNKIEEIISALKTFLIDQNLKHQLRKKGLKNIEKYSWEKCAQETIKILLTV